MDKLLDPELLKAITGCLVILLGMGGYFFLRYKRMELEAQRNQTSHDTEVQRELLAELKRMRAEQDSLRQDINALKQAAATDWETQRQTEQGLRN